MSNATFDAIKKLLAPYAKHFSVHADDETTYDLEEDLKHSRTMFAYLSVRRSDTRLWFFPLAAFPELRESLPKVLASKLKSKCIFPFATLSAAERTALTKLFATGYEHVRRRRELNPGRGYYRKPTVEETFAILTKLAGTKTTVTQRPKDVLVALPAKAKVPALFAKKKKTAGLVFKTITPDEHDALAKLLR